jgi:hypothetical protein
MTRAPRPARRKLPRSFKELTPANHFKPATFFRELVLKALLTRRTGEHQTPVFPKLKYGQVAITWIGHASFLIQFTDLNVLIDPNFANWLFLLKRIKRSGLRIRDLPPIDLVLLTHAHFDHFHKPTLRKLPHPKMGIMPRGVGDSRRRNRVGKWRSRRASIGARARWRTSTAAMAALFWSIRDAKFITQETARISTVSRKSENALRRKSRCYPLERTILKRSGRCTWGPMRQ